MIKVGFIGAGRMARAMVLGIIKRGELRPENLGCLSGSGASATRLASETGIHHEPDLKTLATEAHTLVLACKPHQIGQLDPKLADYTVGKTLISVLAGISLNRMFHQFPMVENIIRAMPNTPSSIGMGVTGYSCLKAPEPQAARAIEQVLRPLGLTVEVNERHIDAVTGISGSGVAFVFQFIHALSQGGIAQGLSKTDAEQMALQTVKGAAALMESNGKSPADLIAEVVSKGGTTESGLNHMQFRDFDETVAEAVAAAAHRSREISESHS